MSDLGRAVERLLTGGTGSRSFGDALRDFVAETGSGRAAARRLGVAESTVRRWRAGATPRPAARQAFEAADRSMRARRITPNDIKIRTTETGEKGRQRDREITGRQLHVSDDGAGRVHDAYVAGGAEAAAAQLVKETQVPFYRSYLRGGLDPEDQGDSVMSEYGAAILA